MLLTILFLAIVICAAVTMMLLAAVAFIQKKANIYSFRKYGPQFVSILLLAYMNSFDYRCVFRYE